MSSKAASREYYLAHQEERKAASRAYYEANRKEQRVIRRYWNQKHALQRQILGEAYHFTTRRDLLEAYGGHCTCCGETEPAFLNIDHIDGIIPEKQAVGKKLGGRALYGYLRKKGWPKGYQILCANCNTAVRGRKVCPHQEDRGWT